MTKRKAYSEYRCLGFEVKGEMRPLSQLSPEIIKQIAEAFIHILGRLKTGNSCNS